MTFDAPRTRDGDGEQSSWLWAHIGRISGMLLGLLGVCAVAFLAIAGFKPALYLIVLIVAGVAMIVVGGKMRGGGR